MALDCLYRNSVNYTLCSKHSIISRQARYCRFSRFTKELMRKLCYPILLDTIGSPIAYLCYFTVQRYEILSRWSSLYFSVGIDTVLFTELDECFLRNIEEFGCSSPCSGSVEGFEYSLLLRFRIAVG